MFGRMTWRLMVAAILCGASAGTVSAAVVIEFDAAAAGTGVDPTGVVPAWTRFGTAMTNDGTVLLQDNTSDDPVTQSGEYRSPAVAGLMKRTSGAYGVEIRVRPLGDIPFLGGGHYANAYVLWSDDQFIHNITIDLDSDDGGAGTTGGIRYGQDSLSSAVTGIDWSVAHTIFVGYRSGAQQFDFYVDDVFAASVAYGSMARSGGFPFAQNAVDFGDGTTGQGIDVAAEWQFVRVHDTSVPPNVVFPTGALIEFDAAAAGSGVDPSGVSPAWTRYGTAMTNDGAFLLQDNTGDDPATQSGEYLSPSVPGLMRRTAGEYGIEVRARPLSDVPFIGSSHYANAYVFWSDDQFAHNITLDLDADDAGGATTGAIRYGQNSLSPAITGIDWSEPRTVFIGYRGGSQTFDFYLDGVLQNSLPYGNMARFGSFPFAQDAIDFGDGTTGQGIDVAVEWYSVSAYASSCPPGFVNPPGLLAEFDASTGQTPVDVGWTRSGTPMTNTGGVLIQDNTADDPLTQSGGYTSPRVGCKLMLLGEGEYGIEFRVKPLTDIPDLGFSHYANLFVTWSDDSYIYNITVDKDSDDDGAGTTGGLRYGQNSMSTAATGIDWSVPHTVFVGYRGDAPPLGEFDLYIDGSPAGSIAAAAIAREGGFPFAQDAVFFGDGTSGQPAPFEIDVAAEWSFVRVYGSATPPVTSVCNDPVFDVDGDGSVDHDDFDDPIVSFVACATGPGAVNTFNGLSAECKCLDANGDSSIDQADFAGFQRCLTEPPTPADPSCDDGF